MAYKWIALSNTTLGVLLATINQSIVIISLPAIFRGIGLDPLAPGNTSYLLWMLMGYLLVSAVLVVTLGRFGDMLGRVRIYNLGFLVFSIAAVLLSIDPFHGEAGALWLIVWRVVQGVGGAMLMANSTAILTDSFGAHERGMALGINQVAALAGSFIGLVAGGLLAQWNWRAVFLVSVPIGIAGTIWSYASLKETARKQRVRIDWWGNITFAVGLTALLAAITYGIQPYGGRTEGWTNPLVLAGLIGGGLLLVAFVFVETKVADPLFHLGLFRIRAFAAGNIAALLSSIARGGMQFMLIIWLQGIWLPLHGYAYEDTPLWAGIYLLPLTAGFLAAGPLSGRLSDRHGARLLATGGLLLVAATFLGLLLLPVDFPYWAFATLIALNGIGSGLFSAPNTSAVMSSVPADQRGVASGMRATAHERWHGALDRRVLLAAHHRAGPVAAVDARRRPGRGRGTRRCGRPGHRAAAGGQRVRRLPRGEPGQAAARPGRDREAARRQGDRADRAGVLPRADLRSVPLRADRGLHRGGGDVGGRRCGLARSRQAVRPHRAGAREAGAAGRRRELPLTCSGCFTAPVTYPTAPGPPLA